MGRILVADDHDSLAAASCGRSPTRTTTSMRPPTATSPSRRLHEGAYDVVLSDLKMGGSDGMDVLRTAKSLHPTTNVILMTAFGTVNTAVEAMKIGAFDYVQKPFEIEEMELKVNKAIEHRRLKHEIEYLRHTQQDIYDFDRIVGASGALQSVLAIVKKVAKSNTTVLIRGETGTGKELIAGATHHNSLRAGPQLRQGELRGAAGEPAGIGAVRPREGGLHRRRQAAHRPASNRPTAARCSSTRSAT
jgi:DNA-binding NtrC family response regulator